MASKQLAAVVELYQRWFTDPEWTPQDDRLLLPEADDAIARPAGRLRPSLGA